MSALALLDEAGWDRPFFKILSRNDTAEASGHQGGMVIPKDLRPFFPGLAGPTSAANPTLDRRLEAELYVGSHFLERVSTRYQYQTWSGERPPESRLTDRLVALRSQARGGDILLFQRRLPALDHYRLILVRQGTPEHAELTTRIGGVRWGVLDDAPLTEAKYEQAKAAQLASEASPFELVDRIAEKNVSTKWEFARSAAFQQRVLEQYDFRCAFCGEGLLTLGGAHEIEAAHIVPRAKRGQNDTRNGLALCRRHHWAFDRGMISVDASRQITIPHRVRLLPANAPLAALAGRPLRDPKLVSLRAHDAALEWHRLNVRAE